MKFYPKKKEFGLPSVFFLSKNLTFFYCIFKIIFSTVLILDSFQKKRRQTWIKYSKIGFSESPKTLFTPRFETRHRYSFFNWVNMTGFLLRYSKEKIVLEMKRTRKQTMFELKIIVIQIQWKFEVQKRLLNLKVIHEF